MARRRGAKSGRTGKTSARTKRERRAAERAARRRRRTLQTVAWVSGALALVILVGYLVVRGSTSLPGQPVPNMGNAHLQPGEKSPVPYNSRPPTSGPHYGTLAEWGVHDQPIPDEVMVHNLEDGGVGVWYHCPDGCPELVDQLKAIVQRYEDKVLMAPYPDMDTRIALTAWNRIDKFDEFDEARIVRFIEAFRGIDHHAR